MLNPLATKYYACCGALCTHFCCVQALHRLPLPCSLCNAMWQGYPQEYFMGGHFESGGVQFKKFQVFTFPVFDTLPAFISGRTCLESMMHVENRSKGACVLALELVILQTTTLPVQTPFYITRWQRAQLAEVARAQLLFIGCSGVHSECINRSSGRSIESGEPERWVVKWSSEWHFYHCQPWENPALR